MPYSVAMPSRSGSIHVATTKRLYKDTLYQTHLLRRSYRVGSQVKHETLGNISHLPEELIELIRRFLAGERSEENRQLREETDSATRKLSAALQRADGAPENAGELQRLRGEVSRLRESARELANLRAAATATGNESAMDATLKSWSTRAAQLKQRLEEMPEKKIPELQLITEKEWFDAIKNGKPLQTDADFRQASKVLRDIAKSHFADMTRGALRKYAEANSGLLPTDLAQLKPYFDGPVDDSIFQRYSMLQSGKNSRRIQVL